MLEARSLVRRYGDFAGSEDAAGQIRAHFGLQDRVSFHQLDLLDGRHPSFANLSGATVFTYYCFEQLKQVGERVPSQQSSPEFCGSVTVIVPRRLPAVYW